MKAISIKQPWASLILHCGKDIENRKWPTKYRGTILIHAGKNPDSEAEVYLSSMPAFRDIVIPSWQPRGGIIGQIDIMDCVTEHSSRWFFGPFGFVLSNPVAFKNLIPYKGQLGIFDVPDEFLEEFLFLRKP